MTHVHRLHRPSPAFLRVLAAVSLAIPSGALAHPAHAAVPGAQVAPLRSQPAPASTSSDTSVVVENTANEVPRAQFVGRLRRPLDDYRTRGRAFDSLVRDKPWYGRRRARPCIDCPPGAVTAMRIQAISNAHRDPLSKLPRHGVVVGRMVNDGQYIDAGTGIRPGTGSRPDEYYVVIKERARAKGRGRATVASLWIARLSFDASGAPLQDMRITRAKGLYVKCPPHGDPVPLRPDGDFRNCPAGKRAGAAPASEAHRTGLGLLHLVGEGTPGQATAASAWFSCDGGCCTAQWPPDADGSTTQKSSLLALLQDRDANARAPQSIMPPTHWR